MSETSPGTGRKCRVCSMPFAADLTSCPSCAYDLRAAAQAGEGALPEAPHGLRRWKTRRQRD